MTTLPQTTTVRLPRPASASQISIPGAPGMPVLHQAAGPAQMTGADVWRIIRSNMWMIAIFVIAAGIGGFFLNRYLKQNHPRYTATGLLQILPQVNYDPLKPERSSSVTFNLQELEIEQRTQTQFLKSEELLSDVLQTQNSEIRKTAWYNQFPNSEAAKQDLMDNFRVSPVPDSKLITVSMTCRVPTESKIIIEELVRRHLENQRSIGRNKQSERVALLNTYRMRYQSQLGQKISDIRQRAVELNIDGLSPGRMSAKDQEMMNLIRARFELERIHGEAKGQLESFQQALSAGMTPPAVEQEVMRNPEVMFARNILSSVELEMASITNLGHDHRQMETLRSRKEFAERKLRDVRAQVEAQTSATMLEMLRSAAANAEAAFKDNEAQIAGVKEDMGRLSNSMNEYLALKQEEEDLRLSMKKVQDELDAISSTGNTLSNVDWATRPIIPEQPSFPRLPLTLGASVMLGLALSLGIAFLREITDTSVRSPRDIARVGQMNLLGMVTHESDDPQAAGSRLPLLIFDAPQSMIAEQLRQVRTRLQHASSLDTTRSILVTSPGPGDGKTMIASNLACGLALNGRRILLVDANFRRPELHKLFDLTNDKGFSDVLNSIELFEQCVRDTQIPNLTVLTSGDKPTNPTELLESQLLIDFIERALEEFDHVIFDSGPLLFVADTVALAPRVDGVVSVVRARSNSRGVLQRMRDSLRQLKAEHLGVVLNAVRAQAGGYYTSNIKTYYAYQSK